MAVVHRAPLGVRGARHAHHHLPAGGTGVRRAASAAGRQGGLRHAPGRSADGAADHAGRPGRRLLRGRGGADAAAALHTQGRRHPPDLCGDGVVRGPQEVRSRPGRRPVRQPRGRRLGARGATGAHRALGAGVHGRGRTRLRSLRLRRGHRRDLVVPGVQPGRPVRLRRAGDGAAHHRGHRRLAGRIVRTPARPTGSRRRSAGRGRDAGPGPRDRGLRCPPRCPRPSAPGPRRG